MSHHKLCCCVLINCNHVSFSLKNFIYDLAGEIVKLWCFEVNRHLGLYFYSDDTL